MKNLKERLILENKIRNFVKGTLGVTPEINGYKYIIDALIYIINKGDPSEVSYTAMYSDIGNKYNTNGSAVERAIRHALTLRVLENSQILEDVEELVGVSFDEVVFTNSRFLALCAEALMTESE